LPQAQNVAVQVDRLYSGEAELAYTDVRSSLGHVDDEKGRVWSAVLQSDYVNASAFTRLFGHYDVGQAARAASDRGKARTLGEMSVASTAPSAPTRRAAAMDWLPGPAAASNTPEPRSVTISRHDVGVCDERVDPDSY